MYVRKNNSTTNDIVVNDTTIDLHAINMTGNFPNIDAFNSTFNVLPKYLPIKHKKVLKNADGNFYMQLELFECELVNIVVNELIGIDDGFGGSNGVEDAVYSGKACRVKRKFYESDKTATYSKLIDWAYFLPIEVKRNYKVEGYLSLEMDKNIIYCAEKLR